MITVHNSDPRSSLLHSTPLLCLQPITFFSLPVNLHFSLLLFLSAFNSKSLYVSPPLSISLSASTISPCISLSTSNCISHSWCINISHSLSHSLHLSPNSFLPFSSPNLSLFVYACLFLGSVSVQLHHFLSLSISICLSRQVGFSEGCTLTRWNGVSLFLQRWRHFAVRITTPHIDGEQGEDFRGQREQALSALSLAARLNKSLFSLFISFSFSKQFRPNRLFHLLIWPLASEYC